MKYVAKYTIEKEKDVVSILSWILNYGVRKMTCCSLAPDGQVMDRNVSAILSNPLGQHIVDKCNFMYRT